MIYRRRIVCNALATTLGVSVFREVWPQAIGQYTESMAEVLLRQAGPAILQRADDSVSTIAFDSKGTRLALGYESGTVLLWTGPDAATPIVITAHKVRTNGVRFSSEGDHFFTNSVFDDETRIWDASTGGRLHTIPKARGPVLATGISDTSLVAGSSALHLYHHPTRRLSPPAVPAFTGVPTSLSYDSTRRAIAVGTASGTLDIWRLDGNDVRAEIWREGAARPFNMGDWINRTWFSRNGERLWLVTSRAVEEWSVQPLVRHKVLVTTLKAYGSVVDDSRSFLALVGSTNPSGGGTVDLEIVSIPEGRTVSLHRNIGGIDTMTFLPGTRTLMLTSLGRIRRIALE